MRIGRIIVILLAAALCGAPGAAASAPDFQAVVVKPGDTLWSIAEKYLKDPSKWDQIVKYNKSISSDPTVALPGMTLRVPAQLIKEELRAAYLVSRVNSVLFRRSATATWKPATDNMDFYRNDWIRTMEDSAAQVRFPDGDSLRVWANSMAVIQPVGKDYVVELKRGGTYYGRAKIVTPAAVVTPMTKDTRYFATVRDDMNTKIEVVKGNAMVEAAGKTVMVKSGMVSEVAMGQAPSAPVRNADLPGLEARAAELKTAAPIPNQSMKPAPFIESKNSVPLTPIDDKNPEARLAELKLGSMVAGYRIQCSDNQDMSELRVGMNVDGDRTVSAASLGIPPGEYWCRVAPLDLLGVAGKFTNPRRYMLR